jgi:hypothetical protein
MADNVTVDTITGSPVIACDDVGGVQYQRVKLVDGTADSTTAIAGGANGLKVDLSSTGANTNKLLVTADIASAQTLANVTTVGTITNAVTANLGATDNAVLDDIAANQTDASQKTQIVDGSGNVIGATSNALDVNIKSGSSSGTQYTEGDTDATITGTAILWEDTSNTLATVNASKPLPTDLYINGNIAYSGAGLVGNGVQRVTLGSNDPAVAALQIMDDWDDDNFCNVNMNIAGVDVDGNSGNKSAQTMRVVIATDQPALTNKLLVTEDNSAAIKTAVEIMDDWDSGDTCKVTAQASTAVIGEIIPSTYATTDNAKFMRKYYTNAGAVTDGIVWSPAAGTRWYVTDLIVNTSAAATVTFEDDKAGGDDPVLKLELAANGGMVSNFKTPLASGEDAADLIVTTSAGNIYICAIGYEV